MKLTLVQLFDEMSGGALASGNTARNNGFGEMVLRIGLFMLFLLIFVFVCAYAWRTIPALRALLPRPKPQDEQTPPVPRVLTYLQPVKSDSVADAPEENEVVKLSRPSVYRDPLAEAIADGRPGSVVHAASDLDGLPTPPAIIILKRED